MKLAKLVIVVCAAFTVSGCLATVATVGASLATGIVAGCDNAATTVSANRSTVSGVCGSLFGK